MEAATRKAPLPEEIDDKKRQFRAGNSDPEKERIVAETPEDESNGRQSLHEPVKFRSKLILQLQPIEMIPHRGRSEIREQIPAAPSAAARRDGDFRQIVVKTAVTMGTAVEFSRPAPRHPVRQITEHENGEHCSR